MAQGWKTEASIIVVGVAGICMAMVTPGFLGGLVSTAGLTERQASFVAAADLAGMTFGIIAVSPFIHRLPWKALALAGLLLLVVGNLFSAANPVYIPLIFSRIVGGAGEGVSIAAMVAAGATMPAPTRVFGLFTACNLATTSAIFFFLPSIFSGGGVSLLLVILAGLGLVAMAGIPWFPTHPQLPPATADSPAPSRGGLTSPLLGLAGSFLLYAAIGAIWPQMAHEGVARGLAMEAAASQLSRATLIAILGALAAASLGQKLGDRGILIGSLPICAVILAIGLLHSLTIFPWLVACFASFWMFVSPFYMAQLAQLDPSGRVVSFGMAAQFGGFSLGSLLAGAILAERGFDTVAWMAALLCAISIILMRIARRLAVRISVPLVIGTQS